MLDGPKLCVNPTSRGVHENRLRCALLPCSTDIAKCHRTGSVFVAWQYETQRRSNQQHYRYSKNGRPLPTYVAEKIHKRLAKQLGARRMQEITMGTGQFCTKPGLVFTDGNEAFRQRLIDLAMQTRPGCLLNGGIARGFSESLAQMQALPDVETLVADGAPTAAETGVYVLETTAAALVRNSSLASEMFGPATMLVRYSNLAELLAAASALPGQLTATIHGDETELANAGDLIAILADCAGRLIFNQFPTGVEVGYAMVHGGPYPATTDSSSTSVGAAAIRRFARPVCFQNFPDSSLPPELQATNPLGIRRLVDGRPE